MTPLEYVDEWLHCHHLTWLSRAIGVCTMANRRLDQMGRES